MAATRCISQKTLPILSLQDETIYNLLWHEFSRDYHETFVSLSFLLSLAERHLLFLCDTKNYNKMFISNLRESCFDLFLISWTWGAE